MEGRRTRSSPSPVSAIPIPSTRSPFRSFLRKLILVRWLWLVDSSLHAGMKFVLEQPENPEWLARFPMTKSASKAMDTVTDYMANRQGQTATINDFVVAGASKRGWTTWSVGCVEPRVKAIVPVVMDLLNLVNNTHNHWRSLGGCECDNEHSLSFSSPAAPRQGRETSP